MKSEAFWERYNQEFRPKLNHRAENFGKMFEYLDRFDRPVGIIETGCARDKDNWDGDGGSTMLFDMYAEFHHGSKIYTVDINEQATALCRNLVSNHVTVHTGDSVAFLKSLSDKPPADLPHLDLLYLDSYDVDFNNAHSSAFHHIKELIAIAPLMRSETLVVVDDAPNMVSGYVVGNEVFFPTTPATIGGKGKYLAEYAQHVGAESYFTGYQCGWTKFRS